mmetsp:Transcript_117737/g.375312  ORF Transcript_117737/g.375312 Transcript_117737/m.375312 type:complete len:224 (+) Transcript_117737:139-810(+)
MNKKQRPLKRPLCRTVSKPAHSADDDACNLIAAQRRAQRPRGTQTWHQSLGFRGGGDRHRRGVQKTSRRALLCRVVAHTGFMHLEGCQSASDACSGSHRRRRTQELVELGVLQEICQISHQGCRAHRMLGSPGIGTSAAQRKGHRIDRRQRPALRRWRPRFGRGSGGAAEVQPALDGVRGPRRERAAAMLDRQLQGRALGRARAGGSGRHGTLRLRSAARRGC